MPPVAPSAYPMNDVVRWDPAEGVIGIVGLSPAATADFWQRLTALTPARKDWEHVRVLIDSNPKIPSRGRHLELGETDPSPYIRACIEELAARGATVVAVPCNTAHLFHERYAPGASVRVPHMIDLTVSAVGVACGRMPQRLAVLGTRYTLAHDQYGRRLRAQGGGCLNMTELQPEVTALIEWVKQGGDVAEGQERMAAIMKRCRDADAFVIGCTELSVVSTPSVVSVPVLDGNTELARHCLAVAQGRN